MRAIRRIWLIMLIFSLVITAAACSDTNGDDPAKLSTEDPATPINATVPGLVSGSLGKQLDDYFTGNKPLFSGSVLIARQGEVLLEKGYNFADWELRVPNSSLTKFRISSLTKPFTATLIMMMHERGLIDLEASICSFLEDCPTSWQDITVHQLLTHTSGIPEYTRLPGTLENSREPHNVPGLLDFFNGEGLEFKPGMDFQYSNSNYIVLGAIIEQVSGNTYERFLNGVVLTPLEMGDTGLDRHDQILKQRASGYQIQGRTLVNAPYLDMSNAFAAAGMYSTVEDLYKWDQALYSDKLLSQENLEVMFSPELGNEISSDYGYGWRIGDSHGQRKIWHEGKINGFHSYLSRYPDDQATIIILSNIETEDVDDIVENVEEILFIQN